MSVVNTCISSNYIHIVKTSVGNCYHHPKTQAQCPTQQYDMSSADQVNCVFFLLLPLSYFTLFSDFVYQREEMNAPSTYPSSSYVCINSTLSLSSSHPPLPPLLPPSSTLLLVHPRGYQERPFPGHRSQPSSLPPIFPPPLHLLLGMHLIRPRVHQSFKLALIRNLKLGKPRVRLRGLVHIPRVVRQRSVRLNNLSRDGRVNVTGCFDGLYGSERVAGRRGKGGGREGG